MTNTETKNSKRINQRKILDKFITRPVNFLIKHKISPNLLSYLGFFCSLGAAFLISIGGLHFPIWYAWILPFLLFLSGAFDVFDGEVARRTGNDSKTGAFLDSFLDRISDIAIVLGLILSNLINYITGFILTFLVVMISYVRARAEKEGIDMKGIGLMERAERIIILWFTFIAEFWVFHVSILMIGKPFTLFFQIFIYVYMILLLITVIQRITFSVKILNKNNINLNNNKQV